MTDEWNPERKHAQIIEKALSEGKQVPDSALADYPDLAKTVQKEAIPEPTRLLSQRQRHGYLIMKQINTF